MSLPYDLVVIGSGTAAMVVSMRVRVRCVQLPRQCRNKDEICVQHI